MKILYTEVTQNLMQELLKEAQRANKVGKKIYYVVPSSLSFEKEREILEQRKNLEGLSLNSDIAIFDIIVTRFKQLPYYFDKNISNFQEKTELSAIGRTMLFRKILMDLDLEKYDSIRTSAGFIEKIDQLYIEMINSRLVPKDLPDKELANIFIQFEEELKKNFIFQNNFTTFIEKVCQGEFTESLQKVTFIIAGFTRFSSQEEMFIKGLEKQGIEIIIGTYANKHAVFQGINAIGVYKDSSELIQKFNEKNAIFVVNKSVNKVYTHLTDLWIKENDFTILEEDQKSYQIEKTEMLEVWEAENMQSEIDEVAREIIDKINKGSHFKNFTVLTGNIESYQLLIQHTFESLNIPFFFSQQDSMKNHPLMILIYSLQAIHQRKWESKDVISLLKTQLYSPVKQTLQQIDRFEYFIKLHNIHGKRKFFTSFTEENYPNIPTNSTHGKKYFEDINVVEIIRKEFLSDTSPLNEFLSRRKQKASGILSAFLIFLERANVSAMMNEYYEKALKKKENVLADKHLQVWKLFNQTLAEFKEIFKDKTITVSEFLDILSTGFQNSQYKQVPANVDVVQIRDYELVEPRTNDYVYVIGLSQENFPRITKNTSLLSDKDRQEINIKAKKSKINKYIEPLELTNQSKNNFTILSLFNSAMKKLTLSTPRIFDNLQETEISPILQFVIEHSKNHSVKRLIKQTSFRSLIDKEFLTDDIKTTALSSTVTKQLFANKLYPSVSAFQNFYECEYKYFLSRTLHLKEFENVDLHPNVIGDYFHEVFEKALKDGPTVDKFDEILNKAIKTTEQKYQRIFGREDNETGKFILSNLAEEIQQTAAVVKRSIEAGFVTKKTEEQFQNFSIGKVELRGKIDRIDEIYDSIGAIDYKSGLSSTIFDIKKVYDGVNLQLLTYMDYLKKKTKKSLWGALYLPIQRSILPISKFDNLGNSDKKLLDIMKYTGILNESKKYNFEFLDFLQASGRTKNFYSDLDFTLLIKHIEQLYEKGAERISKGEVFINPYANKRGRQGIDNKTLAVEACKFCKFKSICRFEATRHFNQTRVKTSMNREEILNQLRKEEKDDPIY